MTKVFEEFLSELGKVVEIPHLKPDVYGTCLVIWQEGHIPLLFEFDDELVPNTVLLSSSIATIPLNYKDDLLKIALVANSHIEETFSVKPDEDILYLHRRIHPNILSADLEPLITSFLTLVTQWRVKVESITQQPPYYQPQHETSRPPSIQVFPNKA